MCSGSRLGRVRERIDLDQSLAADHSRTGIAKRFREVSAEFQCVRRMFRRRVDRKGRLALGKYGPAFAIDRHQLGTGHLVQTVLAGGPIRVPGWAPPGPPATPRVAVKLLPQK